jgi:hypothetical protein
MGALSITWVSCPLGSQALTSIVTDVATNVNPLIDAFYPYCYHQNLFVYATVLSHCSLNKAILITPWFFE